MRKNRTSSKWEKLESLQWNFKIENVGGTLYCSYRPAIAFNALAGYFDKFLATSPHHQSNFENRTSIYTRMHGVTFQEAETRLRELHKAGVKAYTEHSCRILPKQIRLKLDAALLEFFVEVASQTRAEMADQAINGPSELPLTYLDYTPSELVKSALKFSQIETKKRMSAPRRGGARRKAKYFRSDEDRVQFAQEAIGLLSLWTQITDFFEREFYDEGCLSMIKEASWFKSFSTRGIEVPNDLLKQAFCERRRCREKAQKLPQKLYPQAFAFEHARRRCGIETKFSFNTLRTHYYKGKELLETKEDNNTKKLTQTTPKRKRKQ